jgi:hypothetical protein
MVLVIGKKAEGVDSVVCIARGREAVDAAAIAGREKIAMQTTMRLVEESKRFERLLAEAKVGVIPEEMRKELRFIFDCRYELFARRTQISELPAESPLRKMFLDATEHDQRILRVFRGNTKDTASAQDSSAMSIKLIVERVNEPTTILSVEDLDRLAESPNYKERSIAARSIYTSRETLERLLCDDADPRVRFIAALQKEIILEKQMLEK